MINYPRNQMAHGFKVKAKISHHFLSLRDRVRRAANPFGKDAAKSSATDHFSLQDVMY